MKYLPFVFCGILFLIGFNIFFAEHQTYAGMVRDSNGYGIFMMVIGLLSAAFWAAISSGFESDSTKDLNKKINSLDNYISYLGDRIRKVEIAGETDSASKLEKHLIALEMRITELDSRVSGNDPFGG